MEPFSRQPIRLPSSEEIRHAIDLYLARAYPTGSPPAAQRFVPPALFEPGPWLMSDFVERDPPDAPLESIRSFTLRIGNDSYPHMKLRLAHPPNEQVYLLSVDSHDAFLFAPAGSADGVALAEMKRYNAGVASAIHAAWDSAGLPTERNYLRRKIREAKRRQEGQL